MQVELWPTVKLKPYEGNPRKLGGPAITRLADAIRQYGFRNPIQVDKDGVIIAGHTRLQAAQRLAMKEVPVIVQRDMTPEQVRALRIADNKLAELTDWDLDLLSEELRLVDAESDFLNSLGFDEDELNEILGLTDEEKELADAVVEPPANPVTVRGDVWLLGAHRLVCGDATVATDVAKALNGVAPQLMVTDPPYGVEYDPGWRKDAGQGSKGTATGKVLNDDRADWREAWALFPGSVAYVWHGALHAATVAESLSACKFGVRAQIVWVKTRPALSRGHYHWGHEPALYAVKDESDENWQQTAGYEAEHELSAYAVRMGKSADWRGGRKQSTVWFIEHLKNDTGHGTQKPVECMRRPILNNSSPGQAVYEPFSGSGSTLIACELTGRACLAVELSEAYVDVAIRRWQKLTGSSAVLETDGRTYEDVMQDRVPEEFAKIVENA